jgi:hypothetical protein
MVQQPAHGAAASTAYGAAASTAYGAAASTAHGAAASTAYATQHPAGTSQRAAAPTAARCAAPAAHLVDVLRGEGVALLLLLGDVQRVGPKLEQLRDALAVLLRVTP